MNFFNYSAEIQSLAENILQKQYCNNESAIDYCRTIIKEGQKKRDKYLLGFGYYYLAHAYFKMNDHNKFIKYLTLGIRYQEEMNQWVLLVRSHNMLGINAYSQGNIAVALERYLLALKLGKSYGLQYEMAMVYSNLGQIYIKLEELEKAISYLLKAEQIFLKFQEKPFFQKNMIIVYTALGHCNLELEKKAEAEKIEKKMNSTIQEEEQERSDIILMQSFRARVRHIQQRSQERDYYIMQVLCKMNSFQTFMKIWEDVFVFGNFLLRLKKYEELNQLFENIEKIIEQIQITNIKTEYLQLKIKYYREQNKREKYLQTCARLCEYRETRDNENIAVLQRFAELWFRLDEAKGKEQRLLRETSILREKSERDAVTGLPNRHRLNDFAEEIFEKAFKNEKNLGVGILDIDHYKQYNDGYGHQKGDECLVIIGNILSQMMEQDKDIFCARYGGDEFVVIYYGKTDEEILNLAEKLRTDIMKKRIPHAYSPVEKVVTVSQGIRNTVPSESNRVWDYLHSADGALYQVKQSKNKNGICLVHGVNSEI